MKTITIIKEVYSFNELGEDAKEKAMNEYRENALDYEWYDCSYEGAKEIGALIGINIDKIYFSGFFSQGDGACFEGHYEYKKGGLKAIKAYAPLDTTLHAIARDLQIVQKRNFYKLSAKVKQSGHYMHERCTAVQVYKDYEYFFDTDDSCARGSTHDGAGVVEALRDFMQWIYSQLEKEHDYLQSDASVTEMILENEYEFTIEGELA